ncbi:MAG: hypothetical protein RL293_1787, partial [Bacteroidota bacterium]
MDIIQAYIDKNRFGEWLGMSFEILEPGIVAYKLAIQEKHLATPMHAHGGCIASLMDATLGVGALSLVSNEQKVVSTVDLSMQFLTGVKSSDQLIAYSKCLKKGNKLIFTPSMYSEAWSVSLSSDGSMLAAGAPYGGTTY